MSVQGAITVPRPDVSNGAWRPIGPVEGCGKARSKWVFSHRRSLAGCCPSLSGVISKTAVAPPLVSGFSKVVRKISTLLRLEFVLSKVISAPHGAGHFRDGLIA